MGLLPEKKVMKKDTNPKSMIIFGQPKIGKTTLLSNLDDNLIIDVEKGSSYVTGFTVEVDSYKTLIELLKECKAKKEAGEFKFKTCTIDTVSKLESIMMVKAVQLYKKTPMGKNYVGNDVTTLPNGLGYKFWRDAMNWIAEQLQSIFEYVIFVAHVKDRSISKDGEEIDVTDIALTGAMSRILAGNVDAVGYLHRDKKNNLMLDFRGGDNLIAGARPAHLKGQNVEIGTNDGNDNITYHWDKVFQKVSK